MKNQESEHIRSGLFRQYLQRSKGILHLGAHLGHEAESYAELNKPVVWVEALPHIHARLAAKLEKYPGQQALCSLLGDRNGVQKTFYISNNAEGVSSSMFQFGDYGSGDKSLWPELNLAMVNSITLPMIRLDTLLQSNSIDSTKYDFWIVDLQGAELLALQGAGDLLRNCRALYVEVSTVEIYQGGVLWPQLQRWLADAGFLPLWQPATQHDDVLFIRNSECRQVRNDFQSDGYLRHNQRRLEHLASLGLDLHGKTVLEIGAGIGDHTSFYLDRGCSVVVTDVRPENLIIMHERFGGNRKVEILQLDMEKPQPLQRQFDVVHCYGLLYHLKQPEQALRFLADHCKDLLLLETCVSFGSEAAINPVAEPSHSYDQAFYGTGCRPTRAWVWRTLEGLLPYVYAPMTQPAHEEFPLDWDTPPENDKLLARSVFIASRASLDHNTILLAGLPQKQRQ